MKLHHVKLVSFCAVLSSFAEGRLFRRRRFVAAPDHGPRPNQDRKDPGLQPSALKLPEAKIPELEFEVDFFQEEERFIRYLGVGSLPSDSMDFSGNENAGDGDKEFELCVDGQVVEGTCHSNPKCDDLGLVGACCPTSKGIYLPCCELSPSLISHDSDTCYSNKKCRDQGLHGQCCPSKSGEYLQCCDRNNSPSKKGQAKGKGSSSRDDGGLKGKGRTNPTDAPSKMPTREPTKSPTKQPTRTPTVPPTPSPTKSPTKSPTRQPTNPPTPTPTRHPTANPTKQPTGNPTRNPTFLPTVSPSNKQCQVEVTIECVTSDGSQCDLLQAPQPQCAVGRVRDSVSLRYSPDSCSRSDNTQTGAGSSIPTCEDFRSPVMGQAKVDCVDLQSGAHVAGPIYVYADEVFDVRATGGHDLPEILQCTVSDPQSNDQKVQSVLINLSGSESLVLKETFGAFTIEGCDVQNCLHEVHFMFNTKNLGSADMQVLKAYRDFDGDVKDLVGSVSPNPLQPGQSSEVKEMFTVDVCSPDAFTASFEVDASPLNGEGCQDSDTLTFTVDPAPTFSPSNSPTPEPTHSPIADPTAAPQAGPTMAPTTNPTNEQCNVVASVDCVTSEGVACDQLEAPQPQCSEGSTRERLRFSYYRNGCASSDNSQGPASCQDQGSLPDGPISVTCIDKDSGAALKTTPSIVFPDGLFRVEGFGSNPLPDRVRCTLTDPDRSEQPLQLITVDLTGASELNLKDTFGSLTLEECDEQQCIHDVTYTLTTTNRGSSELKVTDISRSFNGDESDILGHFTLVVLQPGQSTSTRDSFTVDICSPEEFTMLLDVMAEPENGPNCDDTVTDTFTIEAAPTYNPTSSPSKQPTPTPTRRPTPTPTRNPTRRPTNPPTPTPTRRPTTNPTKQPTRNPTPSPTKMAPLGGKGTSKGKGGKGNSGKGSKGKGGKGNTGDGSSKGSSKGSIMSKGGSSKGSSKGKGGMLESSSEKSGKGMQKGSKGTMKKSMSKDSSMNMNSKDSGKGSKGKGGSKGASSDGKGGKGGSKGGSSSSDMSKGSKGNGGKSDSKSGLGSSSSDSGKGSHGKGGKGGTSSSDSGKGSKGKGRSSSSARGKGPTGKGGKGGSSSSDGKGSKGKGGSKAGLESSSLDGGKAGAKGGSSSDGGKGSNGKGMK